MNREDRNLVRLELSQIADQVKEKNPKLSFNHIRSFLHEMVDATI